MLPDLFASLLLTFVCTLRNQCQGVLLCFLQHRSLTAKSFQRRIFTLISFLCRVSVSPRVSIGFSSSIATASPSSSFECGVRLMRSCRIKQPAIELTALLRPFRRHHLLEEEAPLPSSSSSCPCRESTSKRNFHEVHVKSHIKGSTAITEARLLQ